MALINGKPMIGHVYERVSRSPDVDMTVVATCDLEIQDYIRSIGGISAMTGSHHERASDRCAEALIKLEDEYNEKFDIVVMVQGDEPMIHPDMVSEALQPLYEDEDVLVTNLLGKINSEEEFEDRNCIKVVCDENLNAMYFSREPIPTQVRERNVPKYKQVCVIPFRRDFLIDYTNMKPTTLEVAESIDMLRVLEHGLKVRMAPTAHESQAVDTPEDLKKVEKLIADI